MLLWVANEQKVVNATGLLFSHAPTWKEDDVPSVYRDGDWEFMFNFATERLYFFVSSGQKTHRVLASVNLLVPVLPTSVWAVISPSRRILAWSDCVVPRHVFPTVEVSGNLYFALVTDGSGNVRLEHPGLGAAIGFGLDFSQSWSVQDN